MLCPKSRSNGIYNARQSVLLGASERANVGLVKIHSSRHPESSLRRISSSTAVITSTGVLYDCTKGDVDGLFHSLLLHRLVIERHTPEQHPRSVDTLRPLAVQRTRRSDQIVSHTPSLRQRRAYDEAARAMRCRREFREGPKPRARLFAVPPQTPREWRSCPRVPPRSRHADSVTPHSPGVPQTHTIHTHLSHTHTRTHTTRICTFILPRSSIPQQPLPRTHPSRASLSLSISPSLSP